jgi:hypothetical protein
LIFIIFLAFSGDFRLFLGLFLMNFAHESGSDAAAQLNLLTHGSIVLFGG